MKYAGHQFQAASFLAGQAASLIFPILKPCASINAELRSKAADESGAFKKPRKKMKKRRRSAWQLHHCCSWYFLNVCGERFIQKVTSAFYGIFTTWIHHEYRNSSHPWCLWASNLNYYLLSGGLVYVFICLPPYLINYMLLLFPTVAVALERLPVHSHCIICHIK